MRVLLAALGAAALLAASPALPARACARAGARCNCAEPRPPLEARDSADAVFRARVLAQEDLPVAPLDTMLRGAARGEAISAYFMRAAEGRRVTVEVLRVWKGALGARAEVYTPRECCICGFEFADGGEYLIYAYASGRRPDGRLRTFLCTRTRAIARAAADLEVLGPGTPPAGGAPADSARRPPGE